MGYIIDCYTSDKKKIKTGNFTESQREAFVHGWEAAGGYMNDTDSPAPWCCPWTHGNTEINVTGNSHEAWGASWWAQCREEVESIIDAETIGNRKKL